MLKRQWERFEREAARSNKWRRKSSDNVQAEGNLGARLLVETFTQWCGSPTYVYFFRSISCTLVQVPRLRILLVVMRSCPLTLHFSQICDSNAATKNIEIANHRFWVYNHHRVRRCLPQIMAVSSQYLLHLLCMNFSSIGHTFIELLTGRLASCWLISAAKATISSAVPMSTQLSVSDCVPCVFFRCFGLHISVGSGKGRKQIFPISPPFCQCWRSQYCLFLVPGHTFNPLSPELSAETSRKRNVVATDKAF